jgi:hypothetical protein
LPAFSAVSLSRNTSIYDKHNTEAPKSTTIPHCVCQAAVDVRPEFRFSAPIRSGKPENSFGQPISCRCFVQKEYFSGKNFSRRGFVRFGCHIFVRMQKVIALCI